MNNTISREPPINGRGATTGEASSDLATPLGGRGQRAAIDEPADPPPSPHPRAQDTLARRADPCRGRPDPRRGGQIRARRGPLWSELTGNGRCRRVNAKPPPHPRRICWRRGWVWRRPAHPALGRAATKGALGWAGPPTPVAGGGAPLHGLHERECKEREGEKMVDSRE
jgi:hypothetical protein